ncbi:ribonuclease J [Oceanibacterium hippocampi]|uniref:Ribonuclease J 1 n=1 Tax=Oceanibacterium hippocampi TaxID=745714 RepID=A0A1Y5T415_9PROT|nr:ribonuclease J [Oceanibacterium hippocampi]SLN53687.1 Ribonuclease J 1 [Oceanibacterium hippocampi]
MKQTRPTDDIAADALHFLPLGGTGEIGMNLNLYGLDGKWLMVDLGISFADESLPGIDIIMPDPTWIEDRRDDLIAIVLTHAHEDHLGAVAHLWPELRVPVYATPFAAGVLRHKLIEAGLQDEVEVHILDDDKPLVLGPFTIGLLPITHSIPEMRSLVIDTRFGRVVHSGDWKLDPEPLVGPATRPEDFTAAGDAGVLALVCDSTNVLKAGRSGSESRVRDQLMEIVGRCKRRVAVTTFSSNIARVQTIAEVAAAHGRDLVLVGRSVNRMVSVARECGYLPGLRAPIPPKEAGFLPPDKTLLLCTGCQGEPNGAMARIAAGEHPDIGIDAGDTVIFSSKVIPGNERSLFALHNTLARSGVEVVSELDHFVHVSGHPARDELTDMYRWVRPRIAVPVHGEARHLYEHAALARSLGVPEAPVLRNGDILRLAPGPATIVGQAETGRLALSGSGLVPVDGLLVRERRRLVFNGAATATLVVDQEGKPIAPLRVTTIGIFEDGTEDDILEDMEAELARELRALRTAERRSDANLTEAVRRAVRRVVRRLSGHRPTTIVEVVRVGDKPARKGRKVSEVEAA